MKSGCDFLCDDVFGRNCMLDVFGGSVFPRILAAASTISVTLSRDDCLSWRKPLSGMRRCMSIGVIGGDCIATSCPVCRLGCSNVGDCENTGSDLVISRLAGADEVFSVLSLGVIEVVIRLTAGNSVKLLEGAGKKL